MHQAICHPLRFEPYLRPMVWGGSAIARYLGKNIPPGQACGESWEVSDHAIHSSRLATASDFGVSLRDIMVHHHRELLGPAADRYEVFPWLIKLLDANDLLSVQVHPDEEAAKRLCPGESAKTEAWLVLDSRPGARIFAGLKPGVGPSELREALTRGAVADCLHAFNPCPGDCVFIPAGTVHAVGGGVFLAEIQQTSDATFRLFDWNRTDVHGQARKLHLDEAFASIHWNQGPISPATGRPLVSCPYFTLDRLSQPTSFTLGGVDRLQAIIVASGQGRFANGEFVMPGDVWLLPAAMPAMTLDLDAPLTGLLCTLPEA